MKIILVSEDPDLHSLCVDVLHDFPEINCQLTPATVSSCPAGADLYIWDDHGRIAPPPEFSQPWWQHLFIVDRHDISRYRELPEDISAAAILLKPVKREHLSAFLRLAASPHVRVLTADPLRADRDEFLQCLIQANLQIEGYDEARTNLLTRTVHDLRGPLMTASGYCGLLLSEAVGPETEEQKEVLRRMQHSIKRLTRITSAMFELSVEKQMKPKPELRRADIRECMEHALHEIAPLADGKRISISVDLESETGPLLFEAGKIEQVLINLMENACKFTPQMGQVDIQGYPYFWERRRHHVSEPLLERRTHSSREPNSYRIDVRDSGPRIEEEQPASLFEEYTSCGAKPDRSGGGIGLAICKVILKSHRGRVWAENSDCGTRFSFVLPLCPAENGGGP